MVNFEERINELMELSPKISEYINTMGYTTLVQSVDEINENLILNEVYLLMIEDLKEIGIVFHVDNDLLLSNHYDIKCIIWLLRFFKPTTLIEFIRSNNYLIDFIDNEIDEIVDSEVLIHLIKKIVDVTGNEEIKEAYSFLFDKVTSKNVFSEFYLKRIIDLYNKFDIKEEPRFIYPKVFKEFMDYYNSGLSKVDLIIEKLKNYDFYFHNMESYFKNFFMMNILQNNYNLYTISLNYFYNKNTDLAFDDIVNIDLVIREYKEAYKNYCIMNEDHISYYKINNLIPTKEMTIIIAITLLLENEISPFDLNTDHLKTYNTLNNISPDMALFFNEVWEIIKNE